MKSLCTILTMGFILAFSTSTGKYYQQSHAEDEYNIDTLPETDTINADTAALLKIIQPMADSFAHATAQQIDSIVSAPRFFVKKVDIERRVTGEVIAWIKIYRRQNGISQYDTTIKVEIPNQ